MLRDIKNSNKKVIGTVEITTTAIVIKNESKPDLVITDPVIVKAVYENNISEDIMVQLYNEYTLSIGEIAALYDRCYSFANKLLKRCPRITFNKNGRRNRAYGHPVSPEQSLKMSQSLKGRKATTYERTPEIRKKISDSLKTYYAEHPEDPTPHINNWKNGVYDNVDFNIGIGGHFHSLKNDKTIYFRSLLELYYMIQLENDASVLNYEYEPIRIPLDNGHWYTPDLLVNNKTIIELKSRKYMERVVGVKEKVTYKAQQALMYCQQHNLEYKLVLDTDLEFDSKEMKRYINAHPEVVEKYNITFNHPERMVTK